MADANDPQQQLEELIAAQKLLEEQIKQQREVARQAALETIKRLYESHAFEYKDVGLHQSHSNTEICTAKDGNTQKAQHLNAVARMHKKKQRHDM